MAAIGGRRCSGAGADSSSVEPDMCKDVCHWQVRYHQFCPASTGHFSGATALTNCIRSQGFRFGR
jgi:hypothetical protein